MAMELYELQVSTSPLLSKNYSCGFSSLFSAFSSFGASG